MKKLRPLKLASAPRMQVPGKCWWQLSRSATAEAGNALDKCKPGKQAEMRLHKLQT